MVYNKSNVDRLREGIMKKTTAFLAALLAVLMLVSPISAYAEDGFAYSFGGKVTVFELEIPRLADGEGQGQFDALTLKKTVGGEEYELPLVTVDRASGAVKIGYATRVYELYGFDKTLVSVKDSSALLTVIYDDYLGCARYYANGEIACIKDYGEFKCAVDLTIFEYDFCRLDKAQSCEYAVSDGVKITATPLEGRDTAKIIGIQQNGTTGEVRIVAGVDSLCYNKIGVEVEAFVGGVSEGVKKLSQYTVFSEISENGKALTAESQGYKYLATATLKNLPASFSVGDYLIVRTYTQIAGKKHYDDNVKIALTDEGYDFGLRGVIYQNNFEELDALPAEWKAASGAAVGGGKVNLSASNERKLLLLDKNVGNNYLVQAEITVNSLSNGQEIALVYGYENENNFGLAYPTSDGYGKIELCGGKSAAGEKSYQLFDGQPISEGQTLTLTAVCRGGKKVAFFVDGMLVSEGELEGGYNKRGLVGVSARGADISLESFIVRSADEYKDDFLVYEENFDSASSVPAEWVRNAAASQNMTDDYTATIDGGALVLTDMNSALTVLELDKELEYDGFCYEMDIAMLGRSGTAGASYRMGPVFGIDDSGRCAMVSMQFMGGTYTAEAWYTNSASTKWKTFASGGIGATELNKTYKFRLLCEGGNLTLYINGEKQKTCKIDEEFLAGGFGFMFRNSCVKLDNVRLRKMIEKYEVKETQEGSNKIRVATFNIGDFSTATDRGGNDIKYGNGTEVTKAEYIAVFEKVGADLWGLQEDSEFFSYPEKETAFDAIYKKIHTNYTRHFTGTYNGKAFLTSLDVQDVKPVNYPAAVTSYAPNGTTGYGHKWFLTGKINVGGKEIAIASLHFDWACKERRAQQIKTVIEYANANEYCIIIGDFNPENLINGVEQNDADSINPGSKNMYQIDWKMFTDAGYVPANGGEFGAHATLMGKGNPRGVYPWDNIFVSPNIRILNAEPVYESWMNDHAIFVADLEIN